MLLLLPKASISALILAIGMTATTDDIVYQMHNLFTYGTLMCRDIMAAVTGRIHEGFPAQLWNYRRLRVRDENYPGIIEVGGFSVLGIVYRGISDVGLIRLDRFEGEMYERLRVVVHEPDGTRTKVFAYVVKQEFTGRLDSRDWNFDDFLLNGKNDFLR